VCVRVAFSVLVYSVCVCVCAIDGTGEAIAYWLRDLELADYIQAFAKQLMVNFVESLTILTDHQVRSDLSVCLSVSCLYEKISSLRCLY
jgi:hypothetical protein